ncbi:MAG: hypothetical protein M0017_13300 [Desulfobacteraceae bacterium]|nr:hypothetical protein [Desulfobacteraceae bacterium]
MAIAQSEEPAPAPDLSRLWHQEADRAMCQTRKAGGNASGPAGRGSE